MGLWSGNPHFLGWWDDSIFVAEKNYGYERSWTNKIWMYSGRSVATFNMVPFFVEHFGLEKEVKGRLSFWYPTTFLYNQYMIEIVFLWGGFAMKLAELKTNKSRGLLLLLLLLLLQRCEIWKLSNLSFMNGEMWNVRAWNTTDIRNMYVYLQARAPTYLNTVAYAYICIYLILSV